MNGFQAGYYLIGTICALTVIAIGIWARWRNRRLIWE